MSNHIYQFGDKVLHTKRPEWGIGSVSKVEESLINGERAQRLTIRFPNAGLKTIVAATGNGLSPDLKKIEDNSQAHVNGEATPSDSSVEQWMRMSQSEWLNPLAQRKIREAMTRVPEDCTDAFISLRRRLTNTFALYKFDKSGRGLIDWAVAQSGLDDPLSRFTRQELEQLFDRWASEREAHLAKLLHSTHDDKALLREALAEAPRSAQAAVKKHLAVR